MMTPKEALIEWHDYFIKEIAASLIDLVRFGKMSQKAIDLFFEPDKTDKEKVLARAAKKLRESRAALRAVNSLLKKL